MDVRHKDDAGLTICPCCKRHYRPDLLQTQDGQLKYEYDRVYKGKQSYSKPIQEIFPNATPIQREQLLTGICSDECWDKFLGGH